MIRNSLVNFSSLLLCLIPFALLTGPFVPDLFVSILGIIFLLISIKEKDWQYYKNKFFLIFILFYIYILSRSLLSENVFLYGAFNISSINISSSKRSSGVI